MESDSRIIYHLTPAEYFNSLPADQPYRPREFDRDGFIHCTTGEERMLLVADTIYRRVPGEFLLLTIDERKVTSPVKYENSGGILFPHIYGALNRDAIVHVVAVGRRGDGTFLPIGEPDSDAEKAAVTEAWLSQARVEQMLAESADLRARTIERLDQIEKEISNLKYPTPKRPAPAAQPVAIPNPVGSAILSTPAAPALPSTSAIEARVERIERSLHQLAARTESLEEKIAVLQKPKARRTTARKVRAKRKSSSR